MPQKFFTQHQAQDFFRLLRFFAKVSEGERKEMMEVVGIPVNEVAGLAVSIALVVFVLAAAAFAGISALIKLILTDLVWPALLKLGVIFRSHVLVTWEKHYDK